MSLKIVIPERVIKHSATKGGDFELVIDVDLSRLEDFPQANEVALPSGRDKRWEDDPNYNDTFCLIDEVRCAYVYGERYPLLRAQYNSLRAIYYSPGHEISYRNFVRAYDNLGEGKDKRNNYELNSRASGVVSHNNKMFRKAGVPIRLRRVDGNVQIVLLNTNN